MSVGVTRQREMVSLEARTCSGGDLLGPQQVGDSSGKRHSRGRKRMQIGRELLMVGAVVLWASWGASVAQQAVSTPAPTAEKPAEKPKPGPKYLNLRFDEDYSYLDEPEKAEKDLFDPIKNIRFGKDWRLSLGGEVRYRFEDRHDFDFNRKRVDHDSFDLVRTRLHADLKFQKLARLYVEGLDARVSGEERQRKAALEDELNLQNLFLDLKALGESAPLTLRLGRQELGYGDARLISASAWGNQRRTFDGAKAIYDTTPVRVDVFWVKPVNIARRGFDEPDDSRTFEGVYATLKTIPNHTLDGYALLLREDDSTVTGGDGRLGHYRVYTYGSRFVGRTKAFGFGAFDYGAEAALQRGDWANDDISAWATHTRAGYTFEKLPWKPRLGAEYNHASGDHNPRDGKTETFNQLFPSNHDKYGLMDLVGWRNMDNWRFGVSAQPTPKLALMFDYHIFHLDQERDAWYHDNGTAIRRSRTGVAGDDLGREIDLTAQYDLNRHLSFLLGYSHFFHGSFITRTGGIGDDADYLYAQVAYKF